MTPVVGDVIGNVTGCAENRAGASRSRSPGS